MTITREFKRALSVGILAAVVAVGVAGTAAAETIRIAHATWAGFGPLYLAKEKGYFKKHGLDVELNVMEEGPLRFAALRGGQVDIVSTSPDAGLLFMKKAGEFKYVGMLDQSYGADGVVANKDIKTIADLKGHSVAVMKGSVSEYWLNLLLLPTGVKESDLDTVDMTPGDAGAAFVAKKVDAAVTWEPWLSRAKKTDHGNVIVDSTTTPGALGDTLVMKTDYADSHAEQLKGLVEAWSEAVEFARQNPDEANKIMAAGVGGWLKDPKAFGEVLTSIQFYDLKQMSAFVGTPDKPGPFQDVLANAIKIWAGLGKMKVDTKPSDVIFYKAFQ
ncbi:ABC transporter substrate-binding protein [Mesorhizobium australafricanum]|uniref:ABC transporter substrate-binding protein n=1 Tax=Mesorhizobium australafricanum TaxID=3072311 RepID=A0ABU4WSI6_9HYPH|nr:ABC transporter substrate-binding protein [Mesorhizobium sp. VK3E]MDX8439017.1 ABC transporter substrate-binding protein [Mesorhizobium sp. VK3E]